MSVERAIGQKAIVKSNIIGHSEINFKIVKKYQILPEGYSYIYMLLLVVLADCLVNFSIGILKKRYNRTLRPQTVTTILFLDLRANGKVKFSRY